MKLLAKETKIFKRTGKHKIRDIDPRTSAASLRHGACNFLAANMPVVNVTASSGHSIPREKVGSLMDYIGGGRAKLVPGALLLSGWPPPPWGQMSCGVAPPLLSSIVDVEVTPEKMDEVATCLYRMDCSTPVMLRAVPRGHLRPLVEW